MKKLNFIIKRLIDVIGSLLGLILISPVLLLISLSIKLTSNGPIFFMQKRIGKEGEIFEIIKFRTMIVNAEKIGDGLTVKDESDNRITKVGKFLRATSLDELPQLFNVVSGQMSLVGPRPPVTYYPYDGYENYPNWAKKRFKMLPGVTGLTQVTVRNSVSWDNRIIKDNQYIESFNIWLDLKILFRTLMQVFKSSNIYGKGEKDK
ncbi:sugar transferase [Halobacillus litoralis]|uniref:Sugar transferase n=1 Tax=Halobacillus litoralis TaxID=45668 RepID=A0A845DSI0_9BACI|nr:sugar transferase [Halobacillus litoralis]MYL20108.1 sugar transferase [Halobacillus litoralis]